MEVKTNGRGPTGVDSVFNIRLRSLLKTTHVMYTSRLNDDFERLGDTGFNINRNMEDCCAAIPHNSVINQAPVVRFAPIRLSIGFKSIWGLFT